MPAMAFGDFDALDDALAIDRFGILIEPAAQSGLNSVLALRCLQVSVPDETIEVMTVAIQGMEFNFRGRNTYDKAMQASFVETTDAPVTTGIRSWKQQVVGSESGNGLNKKGYSTLGTLEVYDQSGNVAMSYYQRNLWPSNVPAIQLEGSTSSTPFTVQATFTYDKFYQLGVSEL